MVAWPSRPPLQGAGTAHVGSQSGVILVGDYSQVRAVVIFGVFVLICLIQQLANVFHTSSESMTQIMENISHNKG